MENNKINAASNPGLANKLIKEATVEPIEVKEEAKVKVPLDGTVHLPGGYVTADGEVHRTAQVRELNGRDEEAVAKASTGGKALSTILSRATVSIGDIPVTEKMLDEVLSADKDALLLGIYQVTFGNTAELGAYCIGCQDVKNVEIDTRSDIQTKILVDAIEDRTFNVQGRSKEYAVTLPTGKAAKGLVDASDKTLAELNTLLLEYCVTAIDGKPVLGKFQIQEISVSDRRKILKELIERNPGPQFEDVTVTCPDCETEVVVPINLGALFQL